MWEESLSQPRDEDGWPLQALRRVQGDQRHALRVAVEGILISDQGRIFNKSIECIKWRELHESPRDPTKLQEVGPTLLTLHAL